MEVPVPPLALGPLAVALALVALGLLYGRCGRFRFCLKMGLYHAWLLALALLAIPLCAPRGRHVHNMRTIRALLLHVKRLYGIRIAVRGGERLPPKCPYVVVSNHQSSLDLLGMMEVLPERCVPIAKRELLYMGAVGAACWLGGIIFIDRQRPRDAIGVMAEAARTMLSQDIRVWVFPEGTRNHSGSMLPFKRGAFHLAVQAQVPVVPIVISSYQHFYSRREWRFTAGQCVVQVLPPCPTAGLGPADVPALTERVRAAMLGAFEELSAELRPTEPAPRRPIEPAPQRPIEPDPQRPTEPAPQRPIETAPQRPTEPAPQRPTEPAPQRPTDPAPRSPIEPACPTDPAPRSPIEPACPTDPAPRRPIEPACPTDPACPTEPDPQHPIETAPRHPMEPACPMDLASQ